MKTNSQIRLENARSLRDELCGKSQKRFAEILGKEPNQISHLIGSNPRKSIGDDIAREIEIAFNKDKGWIDYDWSFINMIRETTENRLPVVSWVKAGNWSEVVDPFEPGDADEHILVSGKYSSFAFCTRVKNDSMTNPSGSPSFPEGSYITVEPEQWPESGDFVIVRLEDSHEATFKQLIIDGNNKYLKALNPAYGIKKITEACVVVGVVKDVIQKIK